MGAILIHGRGSLYRWPGTTQDLAIMYGVDEVELVLALSRDGYFHHLPTDDLIEWIFEENYHG